MTNPTGDALKASAAQGWKPPQACDGKEQLAFEAWALANRYDMHEHPLHYIFMEPKTYAARMGWNAALKYVREQFALSPVEQAPQPVAAKRVGHRELDLVEQSGDILVKYGLAPHAWDEAGREALEAAASEIIVLARLPSAPTPTEAPSVESRAAGFAEWLNSGPEIAKAAGVEVEIVAITSEGGTLKLTSSDFEVRAALAAEGSAE